MPARAVVQPLGTGVRASSDGPSDAELIEALRRREPWVGSALYDRLIRVIEWTVLRVVGHRSREHEDLVQSAFEQVVKTVHSGAYRQTCALTSWASSIACNLALNAVRARKRELLLLPIEAMATAPAHENPEAATEARRQLARLRQALAEMNPQRAHAVILHDVNGLDLRELAAATGVTPAAAQSRLSRGRSELSKRLPELAWGGE